MKKHLLVVAATAALTASSLSIAAPATAAQQDMIDLQTYESRRDVAYSTATNIVKNTGMTKQMTAANLR